MLRDLLSKHFDLFREVTFKRGEIIYNEGDAPENVYFIEEGIVGFFHITESGRETLFRVFTRDYIFGHRSFFANENYHGSSVCLSEAKIKIISKESFQKMYQQDPDILVACATILAKNLRSSELKRAGLQDKSASSRVVETLVYLKLRQPEYRWTRKEIAEFAGTTFETATRVMSELDEKQLIIKNGRDFEIPSPEKMLAYSRDHF